MDMSLSKLQETVKDREIGYASVHGVTKGCTRLSDYTTPPPNLIHYFYFYSFTLKKLHIHTQNEID